MSVFRQNLTVDEDRELIAELTEMALAQAAPDELAVFEETDARLRLTVEQAGRLRQTALDKAQALGLPEAQATLLAESFVGALWAVG